MTTSKRLEPLGGAVERRVAPCLRERACRAVHASDLGGAGRQRLHAPGADVAEDVEHALARHVAAHALAVRAMIEVPTGLLAAEQRHLEARAVLLDDRLLGRLAQDDLDVALELLELPRGRIVAQHHGLG
jgi:hypothetical protein